MKITAFASMQGPALINPLGRPLEELPVADLRERRTRAAAEAFRLVDELEAGPHSCRYQKKLEHSLDGVAHFINTIDCILKGLLAMPFVKGRSGNRGGKPKGYMEFAQACRDVSDKGVKQVLAIAENKKNHPLVWVAAWKALWERGYGRAVQPVALGLEALIRYSVTAHSRKFCGLGGPGGARAGDPRRRGGIVRACPSALSDMIYAVSYRCGYSR